MVVLHQSGEIDSDREGVGSMRHSWWVASRAICTTGGMKTQYLCDDFPGISVYSDEVYARPASGNTGWARSYSVETRWGVKEKFRTLREAKRFVENGGVSDENRG